MKSFLSSLLSLSLIFSSNVTFANQSLDVVKNLNIKANELQKSGFELLKLRESIERNSTGEVSRKLMNSIDADMRLNVLKTVLNLRSIRHESADKVRVTIRHDDRKAVLAALDKSIISELEGMAAYRVNYVRALKAINSDSSKSLLEAEVKRMATEKQDLEKALASEEDLKTMLQFLGLAGVVVGVISVYAIATMYSATVIGLGLLGGFGGLGTLVYSEIHIRSTVERDIELAKKRIEIMAQEQARVETELRQLLLTNP